MAISAIILHQKILPYRLNEWPKVIPREGETLWKIEQSTLKV